MTWDRHLRDIEQGIQIPIPLDEDGYLDRECPHPECESQFKVLAVDWEEKVRDEEVFCPICGHATKSEEWTTQEQLEHAEQVGMRELQRALGNAMKDWSHDINRQMPTNGFITMKLTYKASPLPIVMPIDAAALMQRRYTCEKCSCRYAAIGAAFFCPACGHNSAGSSFFTSMETVRQSVDKLPELQDSIESALGRDAGANTIRQLLESNLCTLVASFQHFAEATFLTLPAAANVKLGRNAFQRLDESSRLWVDAIGVGYDEILEANQWQQLRRVFQQRHILQHQNGVIDTRYIDITGDTSYAPGQRLVVKAEFVVSSCELIRHLAESVKEHAERALRASEGSQK